MANSDIPPGAPETPPGKPPESQKPAEPETVTVKKADWDRVNGTLGDLLKKQTDREASDKAKADEEAKKRGEHEKLLAERDKELEQARPWKARYEARVKADHDRRMKAIEKADAKIKGQFKSGDKLELDDLEHNLAKLDEYESLGLLGSGGKEVVVDQGGGGGSSRVIATGQAGDGAGRFNPFEN